VIEMNSGKTHTGMILEEKGGVVKLIENPLTSTKPLELKAGDIDASAFGGSKSGLLPHFTWSGPGKRTIRADLGAGNLALKR